MHLPRPLPLRMSAVLCRITHLKSKSGEGDLCLQKQSEAPVSSGWIIKNPLGRARKKTCSCKRMSKRVSQLPLLCLCNAKVITLRVYVMSRRDHSATPRHDHTTVCNTPTRPYIILLCRSQPVAPICNTPRDHTTVSYATRNL